MDFYVRNRIAVYRILSISIPFLTHPAFHHQKLSYPDSLIQEFMRMHGPWTLGIACGPGPGEFDVDTMIQASENG